TGIVTSAIKGGTASGDVAEAAIASMTANNAAASVAAVAAGATGATDVTGFGLLGHLRKMVEASGVDVELDVDAVPLLPGVRALAESGVVPGGTRRNRDWVADRVDAGARSELDVLLLADAQTSGGLLFGAAPDAAAAAVRELGPPAAVVGRVRAGTGRITLR
ncbi:MAG: selenide, water dikinase, partial [Pseudonocardiales bacterium]|nr:selenide, water dikinase [Pseudonocardiales bacterium]